MPFVIVKYVVPLYASCYWKYIQLLIDGHSVILLCHRKECIRTVIYRQSFEHDHFCF